MLFGRPYYTHDRTAPGEVVERLAREHPTLRLAWNNAQKCWDILAETSKKGRWSDRFVFIMSWVVPCAACGWRRWQKVNCPSHKVSAVSISDPHLFTRLRQIRVGTTFEEADAWADKMDAADIAHVATMDKKHDEARLESAKRAEVNLLRDPRVNAMPRSVKDLIRQGRKSVPISMNGPSIVGR